MILEEATKEAYGYYPSRLSSQCAKPILATCDNCGTVRKTRKNRSPLLCRSCIRKGEGSPMFDKHMSEEQKAKISTTLKGKIKTEEHKANMRMAQKGRKCKPFTEEHKANISAGLKGKKRKAFTEEHKANLSAAHKGKTATEEAKAKMSAAQKGRVVTEETRAKISTSEKGKKVTKETRVLMSAASKVRHYVARSDMTIPEKVFKNICKKYLLPFKFVGDGTLWLGNANPDFVHDTKKIVVEVFGDYWHSPLLNRNIKDIQTREGRRKQLKAEGYKTIILWESDSKREDAEKFIMHTLHKEGAI